MSDLARCRHCDAIVVLHKDGSTRCIECHEPVRPQKPAPPGWRFTQRTDEARGRVVR